MVSITKKICTFYINKFQLVARTTIRQLSERYVFLHLKACIKAFLNVSDFSTILR